MRKMIYFHFLSLFEHLCLYVRRERRFNINFYFVYYERSAVWPLHCGPEIDTLKTKTHFYLAVQRTFQIEAS